MNREEKSKQSPRVIERENSLHLLAPLLHIDGELRNQGKVFNNSYSNSSSQSWRIVGA